VRRDGSPFVLLLCVLFLPGLASDGSYFVVSAR